MSYQAQMSSSSTFDKNCEKETIYNNKRRYEFVVTVRRSLKRMLGVNLSNERIDAIIGDQMNDEYKNFFYKDMDEYLETSPRDDVLNIMSLYFINKKWPRVGTMSESEFKDFLDELKKEMNK